MSEYGDIPRRSIVEKMTPAELAIRAAVDAVEKVGAHPLLTDSVVLLGQAKDKLSDFIDRARCGTCKHNGICACVGFEEAQP